MDPGGGANNKPILPNGQALIKQAFLTAGEPSKKWSFRYGGRAMIYSHFMIYFGDRMRKRP